MSAEQDLYRVLFESASEACLFMQDGQFIEANASALELFGCSREELLGRSMLSFSPSVQPQGYNSQQLLAEKINTLLPGQKQCFEWLYQRPDGTCFPAQVSLCQVQLDKVEGQTSLLVSVRDITASRQLEEKLRILTQIVEQSPSSIVITDLTGKIEYVNPKFCQVTGFTVEEALGNNPRILKSGEKPVEDYQELWATITSGGEWRGEFHNRKKNGELFWEQASIAPLQTEGENITRFLAIKEDITERKRAEEQLRLSVERRGRQVQLSTQVAQEIAAAADLQELYQRVVNQVKEQFGYYHAQVLRFHPAEEAVVLVAGSGQTGQQMLEQGHRLALGTGLVGTAAATGESVLRPEVTGDPNWRPNRFLPETRGELAVPIKLGQQVLGVLDVQSSVAGALDTEDQLLLEGLCGQIAVAIESTRLRQEMEERLNELNSLHRLMSREGWQVFQAGSPEAQGYLFEQGETRAVTGSPYNRQATINPLSVRGEVIGGIGIYDDPDHLLSSEDRVLLNAISVEVAEAMERARLLEQTHKRAVELEAVAQVGTAAATTLATDKLLQTVVDLAKIRFGLYHIHIYLLNEKGDRLILTAGAGETGRKMVEQGWQIELNHEHSLVAITARTRQGIIVNDVRQSPNFVPDPLLLDTRSEMAVPLIVGERLLGVLDAQADRFNYFTPEDLRIQTILAAQVAVALQNARLYQQTQATLAETELLYHFGEVISQEMDLQAIFNTVTELLSQELSYTSAQIFLLDEKAQVIRKTASSDEGIARAGRAEISLAEINHPLVIAIRERQTKVFNSLLQDEQYLATVFKEGKVAAGKIIITPIFMGGKLVGLITANRPLIAADISERDERLIQAVATQTAIAIQRAQLFAETQEALAVAENLYETGQRISSAGNLQEVVAAVAEGMPLPAVNRINLFVFERDAAGELESMVVAANWHTGQGLPPIPVGTRFPQYGSLDFLIRAEPAFFSQVEREEQIKTPVQEIMHRQNIRSLVVLPLWIGSRQVGVLNLEAEEIHQFTEREVQPYLSLAPQVAVAVDNQRLLAETRAALAEVEATQRRYTLQAWETYITRHKTLNYEQTRQEFVELNTALPPEIEQAVILKQTVVSGAKEVNGREMAETDAQASSNKSGTSLVVPLTLRGEIIGVLGLQEMDERQWTSEEIALVEAISEQLTQAAESIRLVDETQQRAAREARVNEINERIQAAQSLEEALQIAVREVGRSLHAPQTTVRLEVKQ